MQNVVITKAGPNDLAACMPLLSPVARYDTLVMIARDADGELLGAGGVGWESKGNPPGFPIWINVLPDRRRRGIGKMIAAALQREVIGEAPALWGAVPIAVGSAEGKFAEELGYICRLKHLFFRADAANFSAAMDKIADVLQRRGRVPSASYLENLNRSNFAAACDLIDGHVRGAPTNVRESVALSLDTDPATAPIDISRSMVLWNDAQVIGVLLTKRLPDMINTQIIAQTVAAHVRGGWANAILLAGTTSNGVANGCKWFEFDCADDVRDTIGLAQRGEAECYRVDGFYYQATTVGPA